jgi:hypothetical protein
MSKFYTFGQNNPGGVYHGVQNIIIEADSAEQANNLSFKHNIYFNVCDADIDCSCCGDRWSPVTESDGTQKPQVGSVIYEGSEQDIVKNFYKEIADCEGGWWNCDIHFSDGTSKQYRFDENHVSEAKKLDKKNKNSVYGFSYHKIWNSPTKVMKMYQSDSNSFYWWASNQNDNICRSPEDLGLAIVTGDYDHLVYVSSPDRNEVEQIKRNVDLLIDEMNTAALNVLASSTVALDPKIKQCLADKYKD